MRYILNKVIPITIILIGFLFFNRCEPDPVPPSLSGEKALTSLVVRDVSNESLTATIDGVSVTFAAEAAVGTTEVTIQSIAVSEKATTDKAVGDVLPVNNATIRVIAEDGSSTDYSFTIIVATEESENMVATITGVNIEVSTITTSGVMLSGSLIKINNPAITELGILVTSLSGVNLVLNNGNQAPTGAAKIALDDMNLALVNNPAITTIPVAFTVPNLMPATTYYFRGYANISGTGIIYSNTVDATTISIDKAITTININDGTSNFQGRINGTDIIFDLVGLRGYRGDTDNIKSISKCHCQCEYQ